jgi:methylase of polypeptide subunit release factors
MLNRQIHHIQELLIDLETHPKLETGKNVVKAIVGLLIPDSELLSFRQFSDQAGKLSANAGWFQSDPVVTDRLATYVLDVPKEKNLDIKLFGVKDATMKTISWSVGLTENFEDEPFNSRFNVGIDFIIPKTLDRVVIALSKNYIVRTLELKGELTVTFQQILNSWTQVTDTSRKSEFHSLLWDSFDLHPVNKRFYEGISQRFVNLKMHLESAEILDSKHAAQFANRLIGRVIFLWFLDKKSYICEASEYFSSQEFDDDTNYYRAKLEPLFFDVLNVPIQSRTVNDHATPFLNGGLFEKKPDDLVGDSRLSFPKNYFDDLFSFLRGYNFTTDESTSEFQQVAIDPEMLGRIFENLLAEMSDETGEQARKAKGAFYTPRGIVDRMCKEALKSYLRSKLQGIEDIESRLYQLVDAPEREFADQDHNWRRDFKPLKLELISALDELRIIDPACGSGAFPIGMMQLLLKVYGRLDTRFDSYKAKLQILGSNIFGVDIEPMAIEISRLRAWLSLIVDAEAQGSAVRPLPNLDFKFLCANSLQGLIELDILPIGEDELFAEKLREIRSAYFSTESLAKKASLRERYNALVSREEGLFEDSHRTKQLKTFRPFDSETTASFFDPNHMFGVEGFDIVIGNPPYVSPKGIDAPSKKGLLEKYGFVDDLYSHFFFRAKELLVPNGVLAYISSKTFWTIQSKRNLRELLLSMKINYIYDSSNPFESAMVDTCVVMASNWNDCKPSRFYLPSLTNQSDDFLEFDQAIFSRAVNSVIFPPTESNMQIYKRFNDQVLSLMNTWWNVVRTSTTKAQQSNLVGEYLDSLNPGDVALLGAIVDGGQGMATGNNGRYLAVLKGSRVAEGLVDQRKVKILDFMKSKGLSLPISGVDLVGQSLEDLSESEIFTLVEHLRLRFGKDILGKGYVYRIVDNDALADVSKLTKEEKTNGVSSGPCWVPYDKGDRDGNNWLLPTPFFIEWSEERVSELKGDTGQGLFGAAVIRNPQFYFKAGVCWILTLNESSEYLKARLRAPGVFDVNAMSIFPEHEVVSEKFLVCLLNSFFIFKYQKTFINSTSAFQINDAKQLPIVIPTRAQLHEFEMIFDRAAAIKLGQYSGELDSASAARALKTVQNELDLAVLRLYEIEDAHALRSKSNPVA